MGVEDVDLWLRAIPIDQVCIRARASMSVGLMNLSSYGMKEMGMGPIPDLLTVLQPSR